MASFKLGAALLSVVGLMGCGGGAPRTYLVTFDTQSLQDGLVTEACVGSPALEPFSTTLNGARVLSTWQVWEGPEGQRFLDVGELSAWLEPAMPNGGSVPSAGVSVIESGKDGLSFVSDITKTYTQPEAASNTLTNQSRVTVSFEQLGASGRGSVRLERRSTCAGAEAFCQGHAESECVLGPIPFSAREVPVERVAQP
jgi:hypothetical protein